MPHRGWIKIHRKISDNPIWNDKPFCKGHAWTDLLTITNHKDGFIKIKNGENINIKRGECGYSELKLSEKWGWSRGKVKRFLTLLCKQEMIQQTIVHKHSIVKVLAYNEYQDSTTNDTTNSTTNRQQTVQQTDTNKNDKKEKNDKEDKKTKAKKALDEMPADEKKKLAERSNNDQIRNIPPEIDPKDWIDFVEHRRALHRQNKKNAELTADSAKRIINQLVKFEKNQIRSAGEAINNSITNGWKGVFEPKANKQTKTDGTNEVLNDFINEK